MHFLGTPLTFFRTTTTLWGKLWGTGWSTATKWSSWISGIWTQSPCSKSSLLPTTLHWLWKKVKFKLLIQFPLSLSETRWPLHWSAQFRSAHFYLTPGPRPCLSCLQHLQLAYPVSLLCQINLRILSWWAATQLTFMAPFYCQFLLQDLNSHRRGNLQILFPSLKERKKYLGQNEPRQIEGIFPLES